MVETRLDDQTVMDYTDYLGLGRTVQPPIDLLFLFGSEHIAHLAPLALAQYRAGHGRKIVISGGSNRAINAREALLCYDLLREQGVPEADMLIDCQASNTRENVLMGRALIDMTIGFDAVRSVLCFTSWYHMRRAIMTMQALFPPGIHYYPYSFYPENIGLENWHQSARGRKAILHEIEAIPSYLERGHLAPISRVADGFYA